MLMNVLMMFVRMKLNVGIFMDCIFVFVKMDGKGIFVNEVKYLIFCFFYVIDFFVFLRWNIILL